MVLLGGLGLAGFFYAVAEYEHMTGWKWALASAAVSATVRAIFPFSFLFVLPAQFGLFCVLWWANAKRQDQLHVDRAAQVEEDRRIRRERVKLAQEQADRDHAARDKPKPAP